MEALAQALFEKLFLLVTRLAKRKAFWLILLVGVIVWQITSLTE
ncbi:hypothetical protein [Rhizobium sp. Leaf386]|nr:hypothetical protein [Rhizobium sp. Leaf386]